MFRVSTTPKMCVQKKSPRINQDEKKHHSPSIEVESKVYITSLRNIIFFGEDYQAVLHSKQSTHQSPDVVHPVPSVLQGDISKHYNIHYIVLFFISQIPGSLLIICTPKHKKQNNKKRKANKNCHPQTLRQSNGFPSSLLPTSTYSTG